ncbi:PLP-dependent transferase, partial [Viridothelium virens]
ISQCSAKCPIQPVANLGEGLGYMPPDFLVDAHKEALNVIQAHQYAPVNGLPEFTEALSATYSPLYGKRLEPSQEISVHSGGTEAILSMVTAFVEPGDEVLVFEPAFDLYELHVNFVGGKVKYIPLHPPSNASTEAHSANDWTFDVGELERAISPRTKMLILNTPHNPLGKIFSTSELYTIGSFCIQHNILILSDEVYERLYFTPNSPFPRIATLSPAFFRNTITIGSVGKSFEATGWRVGYAIGHADLIRYMQAAHVVLAFATAGPAQLAAARGLKMAEGNGFWEERRWGMKAKLESLCEIFRELELPYVQPAGAHYVMLNAAKLRIPADYIFPEKVKGKSRDWKLCWFVLQEAGVATIPVSASFSKPDTHVGDEYLRFVACKSPAEIDLAKNRLRSLKKYL